MEARGKEEKAMEGRSGGKERMRREGGGKEGKNGLKGEVRREEEIEKEEGGKVEI